MTHVTCEGKISSLATSITVRFHPCQPPLHDAPPPHRAITDNGAGGGASISTYVLCILMNFGETATTMAVITAAHNSKGPAVSRPLPSPMETDPMLSVRVTIP